MPFNMRAYDPDPETGLCRCDDLRCSLKGTPSPGAGVTAIVKAGQLKPEMLRPPQVFIAAAPAFPDLPKAFAQARVATERAMRRFADAFESSVRRIDTRELDGTPIDVRIARARFEISVAAAGEESLALQSKPRPTDATWRCFATRAMPEART